MHPILLEIPSTGITILSYRACLLLAGLVCWVIGPRWVAALEGLDSRRVFSALVLLGVAAFVGARLQFVVTHWSDFADRPLAGLPFWSGGLHAAGGVFLLAPAGPPRFRWPGLPLGASCRRLSPPPGPPPPAPPTPPPLPP